MGYINPAIALYLYPTCLHRISPAGSKEILQTYTTQGCIGFSIKRTGTDRNPTLRRSFKKNPGEFETVLVPRKRYQKMPALNRHGRVIKGKYKKFWYTCFVTRRIRKKTTRSNRKSNSLLPNDLATEWWYYTQHPKSTFMKGVNIPNVPQYYPNMECTVEGILSHKSYNSWLQSGLMYNLINPGDYKELPPYLKASDPIPRNLLIGLEDACVRKLYEKVKSLNLDAQTLLVEMNKTRESLAQIVTRLLLAYKSAKSGNLAGAAGHIFPSNSKELANDVLLYKFGVKPLLSDAEALVKHIQEYHHEYTRKYTARKERVIPGVPVLKTDTVGGTPFKAYLCQGYVVSCKTVLHVKTSDAFLANATSLGFTNPLVTAWELTPWSFAIDWFISIGDFISSLDAFLNHEISSYHVTTTVKKISTVTNVDPNLGSNSRDKNNYRMVWLADWSSLDYAWECGYMTRTVKTFPLSLPPLPQFQNPFSVSHATAVVALIRQLFR